MAGCRRALLLMTALTLTNPHIGRLGAPGRSRSGAAEVSAATAVCAMAARCAASRQRLIADSSSEYATCSCIHSRSSVLVHEAGPVKASSSCPAMRAG